MSSLPTMLRPRSCRAGFTLVELLVVVAIIAVLAAILFPAFGHSRRQADSVQCVAQLRQIGAGIAAYIADHDGTLPGPLTMKQSVPDAAVTHGSLARLLESYLAPGSLAPSPTAVAASRQNLFLCPAAARGLRLRTMPTYMVNMLPVPGYSQASWGDAALGQEPMRMSALTNWNEAEIDGRRLQLADLWAFRDADQHYFEEIGKRPIPVEDLPPMPAHGDHRNALFHDFHVARVEILQMRVTRPPEP